MIIYKHEAETTEDGTIFSGKVEIETASREEWEAILEMLPVKSGVECDTICHCNVKENAERIAQILDYDIRGEVAPFVPFYPEHCE